MRRGLAVIAVMFLTVGTFAEEAPATALWQSLVRGNHDFVAGTIAYRDIAGRRGQLRDSQKPAVTVLSCSDSRVPPELVFNQSLGSLFVVRSAGNVADEFGIASIEFAIANGYTKLIVILAHEECGAVKAAVRRDEPPTPALRHLVKRIRMSFSGLDWDERGGDLLLHATQMNARAAAAALLADSEVIRDAVLSGKVQIVSAFYDFDTGEVKRIE
jgi:carbonic anhydrase